MEIHYKCTVWMQIKFDDADVDKEQLIKDLESGIHPTDMDLPDAEWNVLHDTEEQLEPEDNDGQSTIELMEYHTPGDWNLISTWDNAKKDETQS